MNAENLKKVTGIGVGLIIGSVIYFLATFGFSHEHSLILAIVGLLVTLWTNEALPLGVVSLLPIVIFPALSILSTGDVTGNYSKSIIFLFLGGFLIAIATEKTHLHQVIATKLLTFFPNTMKGIIFSLALTSALLSSVISNTTTALLLIPIAAFLTDNPKLKVRFVLAIAYGASIGGIVTPIGTPPNLIFLGFVDDNTLETVSFVKWMIMMLPLALMMILFMTLILSYNLKETLENKLETMKMNGEQFRLLMIMLGLVVLLLVNSPIKPYWEGLGLDEKLILLGFGLVMFLPGVGFLKWEDSKKIPLEIIFLFGAGFSIAMAFSKSGLAEEVASYLSYFADFNILLLILVIATFITFTTEITSNTALISIALPIIYALAQKSSIDPTLVLIVATICASYAFMLPIATPPNAIAMSSGYVKVKDMARYGIIFNILGVLSVTATALLFWQYFI